MFLSSSSEAQTRRAPAKPTAAAKARGVVSKPTSSKAKPKKLVTALPRKATTHRKTESALENQQAVVVPGSQPASNHQFRGDGKLLVPVYLYSATGEMTGATFKAMHVGEQMLAVKIEESVTFMDLLSNYKLYSITPEDRSLNELSFVAVNFENKLALMKMVKPDLKNFVFSWPKVIAPNMAIQFGMNASELVDVFNQMRSEIQRDQSRQTASSNRNPAAVIETKLLYRAQKLTNDFVQSTEPVRIGKNMLATKPPGTRCGPKSPEVSTSALQQQIVTAWSMDCSWSEGLEISPYVKQFIGLTSGILNLKDGALLSDEKRLQLVQELSESNEKNMQLFSKNVQYSTQSVCEKSLLTDRRVDVYYCTRNFKMLPTLSDSFVIMGTLRGNEYLYTLVRASGFSAQMNQNISNKLLTSLGRNL